MLVIKQLWVDSGRHQSDIVSSYIQVSQLSFMIYRMGQSSFIIFKDTLLHHSTINFIQSNVNWKIHVCHYLGTL
jgi:hypothetical protein